MHILVQQNVTAWRGRSVAKIGLAEIALAGTLCVYMFKDSKGKKLKTLSARQKLKTLSAQQKLKTLSARQKL